MFENTEEKLNTILAKPFTVKDNLFANMWTFFCKWTLIFRVVYTDMPIIIKLLIGLPCLLLSLKVLIAYIMFIAWAELSENYFKYTFVEENFSIRRYFKVYFLRNFLLFFAAYFIHCCYYSRWGWVFTIYSVAMTIISAGYIFPIFDKRIHEYDNR